MHPAGFVLVHWPLFHAPVPENVARLEVSKVRYKVAWAPTSYVWAAAVQQKGWEGVGLKGRQN